MRRKKLKLRLPLMTRQGPKSVQQRENGEQAGVNSTPYCSVEDLKKGGMTISAG